MIVRRLPNPDSELYHHGIKGQKWGVRRFQNSDGSLTNAGKGRYSRSLKERIKNISPETKKKIKIAAGVVGGLTIAAATAYVGYRYGGNAMKGLKKINTKRLSNPNRKVAITREKQLKNVSTMKTEDLKSGIERLKLEKQYSDLAKESLHKSKIQVDNTVNKVANATLYTMLGGVTAYGVRSALTGEQDKDLLVDYVAPRPKSGKKNN